MDLVHHSIECDDFDLFEVCGTAYENTDKWAWYLVPQAFQSELRFCAMLLPNDVTYIHEHGLMWIGLPGIYSEQDDDQFDTALDECRVLRLMYKLLKEMSFSKGK